ncbi:MAG TPA: chromosomal replication initiator protein DnaA [Patescibacteria group bacterium]|nr:chromosomal replication initiator protein DnaA [Patescibacteria group bacterium]
MDKNRVWQAVLGEIEINLSRASFITWFKDTFISSFEGGVVIVCVSNSFVKRWIENKYHKKIWKALENVSGQKINNIIYKVELRKDKENLINDTSPKEEESKKTKTEPFSTNIKTKNKTLKSTSNINRYGLNSKYVFENFIVGKSNELAHAACQAVIRKLGDVYNPLFIYGGVGLGKTHLLQAIGNSASEKTDKILYTTSEKFTNNYIQSIHSGKAKEFKNLYRNVDILLIDDVQFMGGKDGTQEEFFHTFNELQQSNKQIVLTSDRPPKAMPAIEKRLISRFESGMVADIGKPDIETKIAILETKASEKGLNLNEEVLNYIASSINNNVRELEGALNKILAYHDLRGIKPDLDSVKSILNDLITDIQSKSITPKNVIEAVVKYYNITMKDLLGKGRKKELVRPRQMAIYLIRKELNTSYPSIGNELGGRDHTTAMHAYNKICKDLEQNEKTKQELNSIKNLFNTSQI